MKKMKKLVSLLLTLVMVMAMTMNVAAAETYTLTLNDAQEGHTYTAYQIFAGDLSDGVLSNIVWGLGVTEAGQNVLGNASTKAATLEQAADAEAFAKEVVPYLGTAAGSVTIAAGKTSGEITGLAAGYYLVMTTATTDKNDVYTYYIMKVVENTSVKVKADVPKVDKEVDDPDANIGDTVTFTLTATMPSTVAGYETYKIVFHDTLSDGLKYTNNVKVMIGESDVTSSFTVSESNGTLTISCNDVLALGATANSQIVVTYTAVLDEDAVIGTEGNPNEVYLEYSNNPNWDGTGEEPTGDTPEDEVKVFTWEIPVFKYTGTDTPLAGAGFTLYKDEACTKAVNLVATDDATIYKVCTLTDCEHTHVTEIVTGSTGKFEIEGLEKGTYYLKETTTPAGYNTCDVVTVVIGENGALTQNGTATSEVAIQNNAGATLPETGGMGTTLFYLIGGILVVLAAVLLITRRRMNAE